MLAFADGAALRSFVSSLPGGYFLTDSVFFSLRCFGSSTGVAFMQPWIGHTRDNVSSALTPFLSFGQQLSRRDPQTAASHCVACNTTNACGGAFLQI